MGPLLGTLRRLLPVLPLLACSATPYVTSECLEDGRLLPAASYRELAAVPGWRQAVGRHLGGGARLIRPQEDTRSCVDEVLRALLAWSSDGWSGCLRPLPSPGGGPTHDWRDSYAATGDGYVPGEVVMEYVNGLPSELRGGRTLVSHEPATWAGLLELLEEHRAPLLVPYMLSPIPRAGRVLGRAGLALFYPLDRLGLWISQALGGPGWSLSREWLLAGEDDIHEHYLHAGLVLGFFERVEDGAELVLLLDPWGGDWMVFSGASGGVEVLTRQEFEARWAHWSRLGIPSIIEAKWHRLASPGSALVLQEVATPDA